MSTTTAHSTIRDHMEIVCSRGVHLGTVDHVDGDQIRLTRRDSEDGRHHLVPVSLVASVDTKVRLSLPCTEVKEVWTSE